MDQKTTKSALNHSKINQEIVDCIKKLQSVNLFAKSVLEEDQEYNLLKEAKSEILKISKKATERLSKHFSIFALKQAKEKFNSIGQKINFEDLFAEANIGVLLAIKNFKLEKWGTKKDGIKLRFSTYAQVWIKNTLNNYCLKNSSGIKFCTTKEDEKVFYNIGSTLRDLKINKLCCDLNNKDIEKVVKKLNKTKHNGKKVKNYNVKKYINSINISNSGNDIENYFLNNSLIKSKERQLEVDTQIDAKMLLSKKEFSILTHYLAGDGLEKIAKEFKSNKETIRQSIIHSKKKLISEKKII